MRFTRRQVLLGGLGLGAGRWLRPTGRSGPLRAEPGAPAVPTVRWGKDPSSALDLEWSAPPGATPMRAHLLRAGAADTTVTVHPSPGDRPVYRAAFRDLAPETTYDLVLGPRWFGARPVLALRTGGRRRRGQPAAPPAVLVR